VEANSAVERLFARSERHLEVVIEVGGSNDTGEPRGHTDAHFQ
jgi:hypothetical protein